MNEIGKLITKFRKENNLTQKELADKLGVSNTAVSKWECGNNLPDITMLKPLSEILNVDVLTLLNMQEETVLEQNFRKRRYKKKFNLIVLVCFILINIILILLHYYIVNNKGNDIKCEDNGVEVYHIYKGDEILLDGYFIFNGDKSTTIINYLEIYDSLMGTKNELLANRIEIKILIGNIIIYDYSYDNEIKKDIRVNELIKKSKLLKFSVDQNVDDIIFSENVEININLYSSKELLEVFSYDVDIINISNE